MLAQPVHLRTLAAHVTGRQSDSHFPSTLVAHAVLYKSMVEIQRGKGTATARSLRAESRGH
eukprot:10484809-Alexandrium_andersonii.AAC.1